LFDTKNIDIYQIMQEKTSQLRQVTSQSEVRAFELEFIFVRFGDCIWKRTARTISFCTKQFPSSKISTRPFTKHHKFSL